MKKNFLYLTILCLFVSPSFAFAMGSATANVSTQNISNYSEEDLVALIKKIQNQLEEIRRNNVQCNIADVDLSIGDGDGDGLKESVKNLQYILKEKGYLKSEPTGYFGKFTRTALINFQKDNNIDQTGELNVSTRYSIRTLKCRKDYSYKKNEGKEISKNTSVVTSITASSNGNSINWTTIGYSKNGFKVIWSKNHDPTYPAREGDKYTYLSDSNASNTSVDAFNGTGTYYVKVCEYLGGSCGTYSNEITVSL